MRLRIAAVVAGIEMPGRPDTITGRGCSAATSADEHPHHRAASRDEHGVRAELREHRREVGELDTTHASRIQPAARERGLLLRRADRERGLDDQQVGIGSVRAGAPSRAAAHLTYESVSARRDDPQRPSVT